MHKLFSLIFFMVLLCATTIAQTTNTEVDIMRSHGKIYVVMAVVITILVGLFMYLFSVEKKIKKLEQQP
jgi:EamA domain-containing membrane protein RarD